MIAWIAQDLQNGLPVVVKTRNPTTGNHPHFIVLTGLCSLPNQAGYTVSDPGNQASRNWAFMNTPPSSNVEIGYLLYGIRRFKRTP
jgi:hypothetical protein